MENNYHSTYQLCGKMEPARACFCVVFVLANVGGCLGSSGLN